MDRVNVLHSTPLHSNPFRAGCSGCGRDRARLEQGRVGAAANERDDAAGCLREERERETPAAASSSPLLLLFPEYTELYHSTLDDRTATLPLPSSANLSILA